VKSLDSPPAGDQKIFDMSPYYDQMRKLVLDGKRSWSCRPEEADVFHEIIVLPLREMKARGAFDLVEAKLNRRGRSVVMRVDVVGTIKRDAL
jgi:hypothetical protein